MPLSVSQFGLVFLKSVKGGCMFTSHSCSLFNFDKYSDLFISKRARRQVVRKRQNLYENKNCTPGIKHGSVILNLFF